MLLSDKFDGLITDVNMPLMTGIELTKLVLELEQKPDFIGVDYAVDNTKSADEILPLAQELGIGVLVYAPFGRTRLFSRVKGHEVPDWAQEFGCESWAQFFIKFSAAHPAVTAVTPATSKPKNMLDNLGAMVGELPDAATQKRMVDLISGLPSA